MERRILIFPLIGQDGVLAQQVLASANIETSLCTSSADMIAQLSQGAGALLIVEERLVGPEMQPLQRHLQAQPAWSDLPILILTKRGSDSLDAQRALQYLGNVTLLERPVRTFALISAARSALRARNRQYQVRLADQRKDEFLATLAHELRNPLAPIRTAMALLQRSEPSQEMERLTQIVERQVSHLTRLVDDLLDVARISTGKVELKLSPTTVKSVVTHALEIANSSMTAKSHRLQVLLPQGEHALNADHARIVQALANLLVNAAKFTPPSGEISLKVRVEGHNVHFHVKDTGRGLEAASLESIFALFAQASAAGEPAVGLGIGLNIAKRFAEMHGGGILAASDGLGLGSEFTLSLPVVVNGAQAAAVPPGQAPACGTRQRRILVVDDNADAADTLAALLGMSGYPVSVAYDGLAAVEAVRKEHPDVVLMDIGMPTMDGYEAARRIRAETSGITLVALTGWGQEADRSHAEEAGFDFHLVKPVEITQLMNYLATATSHQPA